MAGNRPGRHFREEQGANWPWMPCEGAGRVFGHHGLALTNPQVGCARLLRPPLLCKGNSMAQLAPLGFLSILDTLLGGLLSGHSGQKGDQEPPICGVTEATNLSTRVRFEHCVTSVLAALITGTRPSRREQNGLQVDRIRKRGDQPNARARRRKRIAPLHARRRFRLMYAHTKTMSSTEPKRRYFCKQKPRHAALLAKLPFALESGTKVCPSHPNAYLLSVQPGT